MGETWVSVCNPGYFGSKRDRKFREYDVIYGADNWRVAWRFGEKVVDFLGACVIYEEAYYRFLKDSPVILLELLDEARDVYDDALTNVESGFDYAKQETDRTHVQDIAIRRAVLRMGLAFKGDTLIRIRDKDGTHPLSMTLSPGKVPFHFPEMILPPPQRRKKPWWTMGSVEDFYQSNKVLQVRAGGHAPRA